ncbi:hypothetical protein SAMN04487939_11468 [Lysobacter sp. yr284]|nr:hypothetical protein SAMN04487939_11468 [Lysobacter sp. yr284]
MLCGTIFYFFIYLKRDFDTPCFSMMEKPAPELWDSINRVIQRIRRYQNTGIN